MLQIFLADLLGFGVVFGVKIAARQREAALVKLRHGLWRVVIILDGGQAEQRSEGGIVFKSPRAADRGMLMRNLVYQLLLCLQIVNALQLCLKRFRRGRFDSTLIHAACPV